MTIWYWPVRKYELPVHRCEQTVGIRQMGKRVQMKMKALKCKSVAE